MSCVLLFFDTVKKKDKKCGLLVVWTQWQNSVEPALWIQFCREVSTVICVLQLYVRSFICHWMAFQGHQSETLWPFTAIKLPFDGLASPSICQCHLMAMQGHQSVTSLPEKLAWMVAPKFI
jgi:hypothetical protein